MATLPSPRTWSANDEPTATMLNTDLRDAYNFFWGPPRVRAYRSSPQTLAAIPPPYTTNNRTLLTWTSEVFDSDGMFSGSGGSPSSRLTVVTSGLYEITVHIEWQIINNATNGNRFAAIQKNNNGGTTYGTAAELAMDHQQQQDSDSSGAPQTTHLSVWHPCVAGDYFEAIASHTANADVSTHEISASRTFFSMLWLGTA